jgi:hypothetical protein
VRRSQPIRNELSNFKLYYLNIRDIKLKRESFAEIINEVKPSVFAITETHLGERSELEIEGYKEIFRNDRDIYGGGVLIGVKDTLKKHYS